MAGVDDPAKAGFVLGSSRRRGAPSDAVAWGEPAVEVPAPLDALRSLVAERRALDELVDEQVRVCAASGASWASIADVLGVSRQAVHKRYAG